LADLLNYTSSSFVVALDLLGMNGRVVAVNLAIEIDCWVLIDPNHLASIGDLGEDKSQFSKITLEKL
jgi:hypothetical protein